MEYAVMNKKELQKELEKRNIQRQIESMDANLTRAQSVTIGTAGNGTTELTMRSPTGSFLWNTYQPVEVVELIHQLAANIGCHIAIQPRNDFSSWRQWKEPTEEERKHLNGFPPFAGLITGYTEVGGNLPHPSKTPGKTSNKDSGEKKNALAAKKNID